MNLFHTGGCQCGAIRYRVDGDLQDPHLCHCRMCQKASGNYFMALAYVPEQAFKLTRGEPTWFHSSKPVRRGFCTTCGTPLFFETISDDGVDITLGSLDEPNAVSPLSNDGSEAMVHFFKSLSGLPEKISDRSDLVGGIASVVDSNCQHPDHDTTEWSL